MDPAIEEGARRQSELEAAKAAFFARGNTIQSIPLGLGKETPSHSSMTGHMNKLRAERNLLAPRLKELAEQGLNPSEIAKKMSMNVSRVRLISKENDIPMGMKQCVG